MAFSIKDQKDSNVDNEVVSTAVLTDNAIVRGDGGSRGVQTSGVFVDDSNNITGANELTLGSTLTIANDTWLRFLNYAGTGYLNVLTGTVDDEVDVGAQLNIGSIEAEEDAGVISLFNMPVSSASTDGTEMSATIRIGSSNVLKAYAEADGSGGIKNKKVITYANIEPDTDDAYYIGKNDDDSPKAFKGLILKDTTNGKYYRIEVISGVLTATDLTD